MCMKNLLYRILHVNRDQIWPHRNFFIRWDWIRRGILALAVIFTIFTARELWINYERIQASEQHISYLTLLLADAKTISSKQSRSSDANTSLKTIEEQSASIELEAEGFKLRMLKEASWSMVFKFCFTWTFILASVLAYRIVGRKYVS